MKHILHFNKAINNISILLLFLVIVIMTIGATAQTNVEQKSISQIAVSNYQAAQQNSDLSEEEKIKTVIDAYFTLRYEGQKRLEAQDFSALVENNAEEWVNKEKDKRDIEIYIASTFNTPYINYNFSIDYDSIQIDKNLALVQLRESNEVVTLPERVTSKMGNLQHTFTLTNKNVEWKIVKDEYKDEISEGLKHQTKEELIKNVNENYQNRGQEFSNSAIKVLASRLSRRLDLYTYAYNATLAKNYANTYWNTTNPPYYSWNYNGGDCTNFVSQAIYAGEGKTPPDTSGMTTSPTRSYDYDWFYVWNNSGSLPWIRVQSQFDFITGNFSRIGPYGSGSYSYCDARVGDVIQISDGSSWFHEGIVVAASTPCVGLQSIYIDAHDTNRYYMQLTGWSAYDMRVIRVNGWRGN